MAETVSHGSDSSCTVSHGSDRSCTVSHGSDGSCTGEVLVFYLPIRFFYYLANLIIFTRSSRIPCIFFLEGGFKGIYLREKNFTLSNVVSEI